MAIHRGIQSAIFYYLSCAPCAEARYRKKRKKEAEHGRAEREALYVEMPNVYRHPSPSSTNPHWATEIAAGPTGSHRGRKKQGHSQKDGDSVSRRGLQSSMTQSSMTQSSMTQRSNASAAPSSVSVDLGLGSDADGRNDSKMRFQRYQRDDEELWVSMTSLPVDRLASRGSSGITRPPSAHIRDPESYRMARTPAVNDLHPAVVTRVASREETKWMMQPPPTADVMSGKERASRSRSDSGGSSRLSAKPGVPLSREMSQRIMAQKIKNGEMLPSPTLSRASTALSDNASKGQRHDRTATDEIDFAHVNESPSKGKRKPSPIRIQVSDDSGDSNITVLCDPSQAPERLQPKRAASRPQLSTIKSDSVIASSGEEDDFYTPATTPKENTLPRFQQSYSDNTADATDLRDRISRRTPLLLHDDAALTDMQKLAPHSALLAKHVVSTDDLRRVSASREQTFLPSRRARRPSTDSTEEATLAGTPELYDSWDSVDFALPEWVHEHTKREMPKHRWSMDI